MTAEIRVELGSRRYSIHVGAELGERLGDLIAPLLARPRLVIVTDSTVAALHLDAVEAALNKADIATEAVIVPAGEASKSFTRLGELCDRLLAAGVERRDMVLALGGGMVGDLTGFAAAILRRGIDFIQMPTTLLAMIDSSVGGKTGINVAAGKNLVGAFHQPRLVIADLDRLTTLPAREMRAGYAEMVKYGLINRPDFFAHLEAYGGLILDRDAALLGDAVAECCHAKAEIVAADEREAGQRALLNLGHTFGHALEAEAGYGGALLHGEAVAWGMAMAFGLSQRLGLCADADRVRVAQHLAAQGLPVRLGDTKISTTPEGLLARMRQDKKVVGGRLTFVLARGIGNAFISDTVDEAGLLDYLHTA